MPKKNTRIVAIILGIGFVMISIFGLSWFPCPSNKQFFIYRTCLSLGAAFLAFLITGFINFKYHQLISAGGGFALFIVIYMYAPGLFGSKDQCDEPFSLTVFLRDRNGDVSISKEGALSLITGDELKKDEIDARGSCTFKNIPAGFKNTVVKFEISIRGWQFENGKSSISDTLNALSKTLIIKQDSSLCCVYGYVQDEQGHCLNDVRVTVEGIVNRTDSLGYFDMIIPENRRKKEVLLIAAKNSYETWERIVLPVDKHPIPIILHKP